MMRHDGCGGVVEFLCGAYYCHLCGEYVKSGEVMTVRQIMERDIHENTDR